MTRDALDVLLTTYRPKLLQWARRLVPVEDAEDVVQMVCVGLLQRRHQLKVRYPETYLYTAIRQQAHGIRSQLVMEPEDSLATLESPSTLSMADEYGVKQALGTLPPHIACLIELVYFEQVPVKEAVRRTNRAFHKRITLARARYWLRFRGTVGATLRKVLQ